MFGQETTAGVHGSNWLAWIFPLRNQVLFSAGVRRAAVFSSEVAAPTIKVILVDSVLADLAADVGSIVDFLQLLDSDLSPQGRVDADQDYEETEHDEAEDEVADLGLDHVDDHVEDDCYQRDDGQDSRPSIEVIGVIVGNVVFPSIGQVVPVDAQPGSECHPGKREVEEYRMIWYLLKTEFEAA